MRNAHSPLVRRRLAAVATTAALAFAAVAATADLAEAEQSDAEITVSHACTSVRADSTKDLSNVVLQFTDGDRQRFEGLSGRSGSFSGSGVNAGEVISTVWVKSGNNASGEGPGYGQRFDLSTSGCGGSDERVQEDEEAAPEEAAAKGDAAKKDAPRNDAAKKDSAPKQSAPKNDAAKESAPKDSASKESAPKQPAPKDDAPKQSAAKNDDAPEKAASSEGGTAEIRVSTTCTSVTATSTKDLSNVVLQFTDGDRQRFEGLSGRSGSFSGTGDDAGKTISTVWVKSGNNASGDGPGYGERFELTCAGSNDQAGSDQAGSDQSSGNQDDDQDENGAVGGNNAGGNNDNNGVGGNNVGNDAGGNVGGNNAGGNNDNNVGGNVGGNDTERGEADEHADVLGATDEQAGDDTGTTPTVDDEPRVLGLVERPMLTGSSTDIEQAPSVLGQLLPRTGSPAARMLVIGLIAIGAGGVIVHQSTRREA